MGEDAGVSDQTPAARRAAREVAELLASRTELAAGITDLVDFHVRHLKQTPEEAARAVREAPPADLATRAPEQLHWSDIGRVTEGDPAAGQALWGRVKDAARQELRTGARMGKTLEPRLHPRPWDRARFVAILDALADALQPRDALEALLVQQMGAAFQQQLVWQERTFQRTEEERWQGERDRRRAWERLTPAQRERVGDQDGWLPERLTDAEAIAQAVMIADRYQRSFLRLMKAFRDNRRLFGSLIVAGGQVNIGERQINVAPEPPTEPTRDRAAPVRRTTPARVRKTATTAENPSP